MSEHILEVDNLVVHFFTHDGEVHAVDGVSFHLDKGETLSIAGESGSGKSVTALSILRLLPPRTSRVLAGTIRFKAADILTMSEEQVRKIRGSSIATIFQDPMTSLNPVLTIGEQIAEVMLVHGVLTKRNAAMRRAVELLEMVKIPLAGKRVHEYPHQFSGGMRQRAMIAMALACHPDILIADEPTTALDVTIQAQIIKLLEEVQREFGMAIIAITHDLGVVAEITDRILIMYGGRA
ncbi:MAG: ABC transporter ATP-binding protein, partial [Actinobacteria bacterium]|nr:ABC transporter ATP-binding protein [Actinomycetota bacterium]